MTTETAPRTEDAAAARAARGLLDFVLARLGPRDFAVRLWDGDELPPSPGRRARFTLIVRTPGALRAMAAEGDALDCGEAFVYGHMDVEGPLREVFHACERLTALRWSAIDRVRLAGYLRRIPKPIFLRRGRFAGASTCGARGRRTERAVNYHYDQPVEFWRPWLDASLSYSCAYFARPDADLDEAQEAKLEYVCRKLRLRPGMRLLDLGCGWGALLLHAARRHGVEAVGVTLSPRQADVAGRRLAEAGLSGRCRVLVGDFMELCDGRGFDRMASVGSAEHVPERRFEAYFRHAAALLVPGGQMLHHAITRTPSLDDGIGSPFIDRYVFPEHWLASIGRTVEAAEEAALEVRDVESLREHYVLTLSRWLERFEAAREEIERTADPISHRVFRLYLAGTAHEFARGRLNLHQTLLVKPADGASGMPLRREDWYA